MQNFRFLVVNLCQKASARIFFGVCFNGLFGGVQLRLLHTRSAGSASRLRTSLSIHEQGGVSPLAHVCLSGRGKKRQKYALLTHFLGYTFRTFIRRIYPYAHVMLEKLSDLLTAHRNPRFGKIL